MRRAVATVPLWRADLTIADAQAVRWQLARAPFQDETLLARWEAAWEGLWHRPALAFADPVAAIHALKRVLGWRSGEGIGVDPLLDPAWVEALSAAWLSPLWRDVHPGSGQGEGAFLSVDGGDLPLRAGVCQHLHGMPVRERPAGAPFWLEDLSALPSPVAGSGWGDVQILHLSGNRLVAAGGSCLVLTGDASLGRALRLLRRHPPGPLACALGLSQLHSLAGRLARRQELAERYHLVRGDGLLHRPDASGGERVWEQFVLRMASGEGRRELQQFLHKSGIHADSPHWFQPANLPPLPGWQLFQEHMLAIPLYASLTDPVHKRIINRINRWVQRTRTVSDTA